MAAVAVGSVLAAIAPADIFQATFVVIACVIAAKFLIGRECWVVGTELPDSAAMSGYGFVIGSASSLMGISGGSLVTMVLTLYGKPIHNVIATAAGLGVPITLAGTIGYALAGLPHLAQLPPLSLGFVSGIGVVLAAPVSSWAAPLRCPPGTQATEAKTGNPLRLIPAACRRTFPVEPRTGYLNQLRCSQTWKCSRSLAICIGVKIALASAKIASAE
jgi:hypothetical protein